MTTFLLRRIALIIPTLFFVSVLIFGLQQLLPGDPAMALAGEDRDPSVIAFLREKYHLDQPLPVRYALWIGGVVHGDLGESIRIPAGIIAAVKSGTAIDYATTMAALWGLSIPNFWLGILLILLFSVELGLLPASGFVGPGDSLKLEPADIGDAGLRAGQCDCRGDDAAHPQRDAAGAEFRLRPHGP